MIGHGSSARRAWLGCAGLALLASLMPEAAWAFSPFAPPSGDLSVSLILAKLFGGALPGAGGTGGASGGDPFRGMLGMLNGAALTIGGIMAAYTLVAGTMQTAHDGEMLGKRWSSMWLPIRTVMGIGLVVPINGGYCVAQMLVMWLCMQGIGLADMLWSEFLSSGMNSMVAYSTSQSPKIGALAADALKIQVCMESLRKAKATTSTASITSGLDIRENPYDTASSHVTDYGIGQGTKKEVCGQMVRDFDAAEAAASSAVATSGGSNPMGDQIDSAVNVSFDPALAMPITNAHLAQTAALMAAANTVAKLIIDPSVAPESIPTATFDTAVEKYRAAVLAAANDVNFQSQLTAVKSNANTSGWIMAGAWFTRIASIVNDINKAVNATPSATFNADASQDLKGILGSSDLATSLALANSYYSRTRTGAADALMSAGGLDSDTSRQDAAKPSSNMLVKKLMSALTVVDVTDLKKDSRHPLIIAQEIGMRMMRAVAVTIVALGVISLLPVGALIAPIIGLLIFSGMAGATVMAIYLPLMPFILYLGAAFGWVLLVVEAMIAAPLWAVMHLSPGGDDLMGSARNGYNLLLSLMLRPALIVLGFAAACLVAYPLGMFLNATFFQSFLMASNTGDSLFSFVLITAATVVYASLLTMLMHKCFALIHKIPDEILKWFGGQGSSLGQGAGELAHGSKGGLIATGQAVQGLGNAVGQAANQGRQLAAQRSQNQLTKDNAATSGVANSQKTSMESAEASQKAFSSGDPADHLTAFNANKLEQQAHTQAARSLQNNGQKTEAAEHRQMAGMAGERMQTHRGELQEMAKSSAEAYEQARAANPTPSTRERATELAGLARSAAAAESALAGATNAKPERAAMFQAQANELSSLSARLSSAESAAPSSSAPQTSGGAERAQASPKPDEPPGKMG